MAASKIIPKKSVVSKIPLSTDLESGEICINHADKKLYAKHPSTGVVQEIGAYEHSHDELYSLNGTQHIELQNNGSLVLNGSTTLTLPSASGTLARLTDITGNVAGVTSVNTRTGVVTLAKSDVGLENCDNTSDASKPISTATQTALAGKANSTDVQIFTSSGTWTKPAGAKSVDVNIIAGGGGGSSGRVNAGQAGGGGGAGGNVTNRAGIPASILGATETITVGAGGTGGAATNIVNAQNTYGTSGGASSFGATPWVIASGGGGAPSGNGAAGYYGVRGFFLGGQGGNGGGQAPAAGSAGSGAQIGSGGGGGGGSCSTAGQFYAGGNGFPSLGYQASGGQAIGGATAGASGAAGAAGIGIIGAGGGGGGGAGNAVGNGGAGGNGSVYGGGGGGGGCCGWVPATSGQTYSSGAGGSGAQGIVIITTYF